MIQPKNFPLLSYSILLLIWLYTFYVSILSPPFLGYFTVDENYIADSGVFLWYGNTPRCLDWPGTPSVITFFILFGVVVVFRTLAGLGDLRHILDLFEGIDRAAFDYITSRQELILAGRTIQLIIVGVFIALLIRFMYRKEHYLLTDLSRSIIVLLIITSYILWFNAPVLRPEAISGSIFMYLIARLLFSESLSPRDGYLMAVLFGIVLAERLLFVFVSPIFLAAIYFKMDRNPLHYTLRFLALTVGVFIFFCPFLITDPLVVMKSFFGGILAKMQDKPMPTLFNYEFIGAYFQNPVSYLIVLACIAGCWALIRQKKLFNYVVIGNWILFLFLVLRSAKIYDTHVLPAGILTLFTAGLGIAFLADLAGKKRILLALILALPIVIANLYEYIQFQKRSHTDSNFVKAYYWINELPQDSRLLVHPELEFYVPKSIETLTWDLEQNRDSLKMVRKLNYLMGNKGEDALQESELPYVARSFAFEDERLYEIQYQLLNKYHAQLGKKSFTYDVYLDNTELASSSIRTDEAIRAFREGKYDYMITDIRLEEATPVKILANDIHPTVYIYASPKK